MTNESTELTGNNNTPPRQNVETRLGRFFQKINQFLKGEQHQVDLKLQGRIHELQSSADQVLIELLNFKNALESSVDPSIFGLVINIIDPIVKDISQIQKSIEGQHNPAHQVKIFRRYIDWMEKAKKWIELGNNKEYQQDLIQKAIIEHTILEFQARIDRDLQIIQDYLHNSLHGSHLPEEGREELHQNIEREILPYLSKLNQLKESPTNLTLETMSSWKLDADRLREKYFGAILHLIDSFAGEISPIEQVDHESEHALKTLMSLNMLEESISELIEEMDIMGDMNEQNKKMIQLTLAHLEEDAHNLNGDLRLPQECADRVQAAIDQLNSIKDSLNVA